MLVDEVAPEGGDVDQGPQALILFWVTASVSIIVVALRFLGRYIRRRIGLDDWLMLVTLIQYVIFVVIFTKIISIGGLRHIYYVDKNDRVRTAKWTFLCQPFVIMGFATGKLSIGVLLWRVVGSTSFWRKWSLCFAVVSALVFSVVAIVLTYAQCSPSEALWNPALLAEGKATCWSPTVPMRFALFLCIWNILVDVFLALLPATFFCKLKLSLKKKVGLCALLGLGSMAATSAAVKTKYLNALTARSDVTWELYNLYVWSGIELFLIIICGSVAPIKPVYDWLFRRPAVNNAKATGDGRYDSSPYAPREASRSWRTVECSKKTAAEEEVELSFSPGRCDAASPGRCGTASPGRCDAASPGRCDAASTHSTIQSLHPQRDETYSPY